MATNVAPTEPNKASRKRNLLIFTLLIIIIAGILAFLYFTKWRYEIETEDAYVNGNQVQITSQIAGVVQSIGVNDTDVVNAGQMLVGLDRADNLLALETAKSQLKTAIRQFHTQSANVVQADSGIAQAQSAMNEIDEQIRTAQVTLRTAQADYERRLALANMNAVSKEEIQHALESVNQAKIQLAAAKAKQATAKTAVETAKTQKSASLAVLGDKNILSQPAVQSAITNIENAWLNLNRTQITSPIAGQVARRNVQLGQKINAGTALMVVVPLHDLWVDANFKESQLKNIRIGQAVTLVSDVYGDDVVYHGKVVGLSAGTGSSFSVLPAQNATGNWIKVTQRVPVRVQLNPEELKQHPLRVGLSMHASIDSRDGKDSPQVATATGTNKPVASLQEKPNMAGAEQIIHEILQEYR